MKITNTIILLGEIVLKVRGYLCYYGIRGNSRRPGTFWHEALYIILKWLNRRSQRRSYTWEAFGELMKIYKFPAFRVVEMPSARVFEFTCCRLS